MKILPLLIGATCVLLITGCASAPKQVWYQPGKTPAETWQDYNQCKTAATKSADPYGLSGLGIGGNTLAGTLAMNDVQHNKEDFFNSCMRGQGYVPTSRTNVLNAENYPPK